MDTFSLESRLIDESIDFEIEDLWDSPDTQSDLAEAWRLVPSATHSAGIGCPPYCTSR